LSGERTLSPWRDKLPFATSRQRLRVRLAGVNVQMHATVPGSAVLISATAAANRRCPSKARDGRNTSPNWSSTPRARGCLASRYRLRCSQPPRRWSGEAPRVHRALREPSPWSLRACSLAVRLRSSCLPITSLGRDRPRRFILPITALRVTPISRAIWLHESPA